MVTLLMLSLFDNNDKRRQKLNKTNVKTLILKNKVALSLLRDLSLVYTLALVSGSCIH